MAKTKSTTKKPLSNEAKLLRRFARALLSLAEELLEDEELEEGDKEKSDYLLPASKKGGQ